MTQETETETTDITALPAWKALEAHAGKTAEIPLADLFAQDPQRFGAMSFRLPGMLVDFSKQPVTRDTLVLLLALAAERRVGIQRHNMFSGVKINTTEDRAVLHTALRAARGDAVMVDGKDIVPGVHKTLDRMGQFAAAVRNGQWRGHTGEEITDIVNIGIGGSSLGPRMVCEALAGYGHMRLDAHFVSNVEASELHRVLQRLRPETTLFLIASKTFTTAETMQNAKIARDRVVSHFGGDAAAVAKHFVALSTNKQAVADFGISQSCMFPFSDWVGGRYSVWSAIGLSVMLVAGPERFGEFLAGARDMDAHFRTAPPEGNVPLIMAMIGIWNRNFLGRPAYAVIPYHSGLARLPLWLQQLDMESNGKSVDKSGARVACPTGPLAFGDAGTDAQHSFFQWLHQGTDIVPVDFIAAVRSPYGTRAQQNMLLANCLAQSEALMAGQDGGAEPHRRFEGNRPSTTILLDALTPHALGMLLALYEHKVFVQGAVWNVNSFDQFGVELGKVLAKKIGAELDAGEPGGHDASTAGLMRHVLDTAV